MDVQSTNAGAARPYRLTDALGGDHAIPHHHPRVDAGAMELFGTHEATFPVMLDAVQNAPGGSSIATGQYIFLNNGNGKRMLEALLDRSTDADPVHVDTIVDREGSAQFVGLPARRHFNSLQNDTFRVVRWQQRLNPFGYGIYHPKLMVIGLQDAYAGSMPFDATTEHDMMVRGNSALAGQMLAEHTASWVSGGGEIADHQRELLAQADEAAARMHEPAVGARLVSNRNGVDRSAALEVLAKMRTAQHRIWIQTPFFGSQVVADEAVAAARRGVDVRLMVAGSRDGSDVPLMPMLSKTFYRQLLGGDAKLEVREATSQYSHGKSFLIDDEATVGSMNATSRAIGRDDLRVDNELNVVSNDPRFVTQLEDLWTSREVTTRVLTADELRRPSVRALNSCPGKLVQAILGGIA